MFKTTDTDTLKQDKECQPCWYTVLSTMSGSPTHRDEPSDISKYEVDGFRANPSWASVGPDELELNRKVILSDFEKILPIIMSSSIRFRFVIKFPIQDQEPIDLLAAIGKKIYLNLSTEVKETLKGASSIHLVTNDVTIPWEIMHDGEEFVGLK